MAEETVLITGGSGFLGSHCVLVILQKGYKVRTTVRSLTKKDEVKKMLMHGGATQEQVDGIEFFAADLMKDDGWTEACAHCVYVLHVASPFPAKNPKDENELIVPARDGTLRVLKAAKQAGTVKRVVVTSSFAAIGYGHPVREEPFTEKDWTNLDDPPNPVAAYQKSKTIAERAAWDWHSTDGGDMELSTVNPVGIFGPILGKNFSTSIELVLRLLNGSVPGCPQLAFGAVDVRDTAQLHYLAMTHPKAAGQRYLACSDDTHVFIKDIATSLKEALPAEDSKKVPTRTIPNFVLRLIGLFDPTVALITPELGHVKKVSNAKAKTELGWESRSTNEGLLDSAKSLKEFGLV